MRKRKKEPVLRQNSELIPDQVVLARVLAAAFGVKMPKPPYITFSEIKLPSSFRSSIEFWRATGHTGWRVRQGFNRSVP